jgi:hypothetical protein
MEPMASTQNPPCACVPARLSGLGSAVGAGDAAASAALKVRSVLLIAIRRLSWLAG